MCNACASLIASAAPHTKISGPRAHTLTFVAAATCAITRLFDRAALWPQMICVRRLSVARACAADACVVSLVTHLQNYLRTEARAPTFFCPTPGCEFAAEKSKDQVGSGCLVLRGVVRLLMLVRASPMLHVPCSVDCHNPPPPPPIPLAGARTLRVPVLQQGLLPQV